MIHTATQKTKFLRLVRFLREQYPSIPFAYETLAVGLLERLWHTACINTPRGDIGRLPNSDIAEHIGWYGDADQIIAVLTALRWLDSHPEYRLVIHDWQSHAPNFIKGNIVKMGGFIALVGTALGTDPRDRPIGESSCVEPKRLGAPNLTKPGVCNSAQAELKSPIEAQAQMKPNPQSVNPLQDQTPFMRATEVNGTTASVVDALTEINRQANRTAVAPTGLDRDRLSEAIALYGRERIERLWHWAVNSPCARAKFLRGKQQCTVRQVFAPEKIGELFELSEAVDGWAAEVPDRPKSEAEEGNEMIDKILNDIVAKDAAKAKVAK